MILAGKLRGVERIGGFGGKADVLNRYEMFTGDPGYLGKDIARYRAVTPEAVKAFANKYLSKDQQAHPRHPAGCIAQSSKNAEVK